MKWFAKTNSDLSLRDLIHQVDDEVDDTLINNRSQAKLPRTYTEPALGATTSCCARGITGMRSLLASSQASS